MHIVILFGTQSGNAELVADELRGSLRKQGHEVAKAAMAKADPSVFEQDALFVVVVSSYGDGDLPEKARPFFARLEAERPDLSRVRYGMFGLGDSKGHAQTFCFGSQKLDRLLQELGASRIGPAVCHDLWDKQYAEDHAMEWVGTLFEQTSA